MELAFRGLGRFPRINILSVLALALGISASITTLTVTRLLSADPLPGLSRSLYAVQLDSRRISDLAASSSPTLPDRWTWTDVEQMESSVPGIDQTAVINTATLNISTTAGVTPKNVDGVEGLQVQSAFFKMFGVPIVEGAGWRQDDDREAQPVAVISKSLGRKLFGDRAAVGQSIRVNDKLFRVVGISGSWHLYPHFYGLSRCVYACPVEDIFIPVSTARQQGVELAEFSTCGAGVEPSITKPDASICRYLGYWARLDDAAHRSSYLDALAHYAAGQKAAGRYAKGGVAAVNLLVLRQYLDAHGVVPLSARMGVWLALSFLLVCLANVVGLLLTRFLRSTPEIGIRRALGASRQSVVMQCMLEAGMVGLGGGLLALPLTWCGIWLVRQQPVAYAGVIALDWSAFGVLLVLSILASLLVGSLPAWRAAMVEPGLQVKEL